MPSTNDIALSNAIAQLLKPLVRLAMRHEMTHSELTEALRLQCVRTAIEHHGIPGVDMTNARIAILTGLSRKEVSRLRSLYEQDTVLPRPSNPGNRAQRVVQRWLSEKEFNDSNGNPLTLPIKNEVNGVEKGSFKALVQKFSGDVSYGQVLEELSHIKMIAQPTKNTVVLVKHAYIPNGDVSEELRQTAKMVVDVFNTALNNTEPGNKDIRLQREVVYSNIPDSQVEELKNFINEESEQLIKKINHKLADARNSSFDQSELPKSRVGLGLYYIEDKDKSKNMKDE